MAQLMEYSKLYEVHGTFPSLAQATVYLCYNSHEDDRNHFVFLFVWKFYIL